MSDSHVVPSRFILIANPRPDWLYLLRPLPDLALDDPAQRRLAG